MGVNKGLMCLVGIISHMGLLVCLNLRMFLVSHARMWI